ncbi:MAG: carboxylate-amine ligase [Alphaproteobacteria bacterium]|nr:carboxylate-amine ligase [Alphaproteobacteria bacterium]
MKDDSFTIGMEEEYLLIDKDTGELAGNPPEELVELCNKNIKRGKVHPELLTSQIEISTDTCSSISELKECLVDARRAVIQTTEKYNIAPLASSTHPMAEWRDDHDATPKERYIKITQDLQTVAKRFVVSGMHIHVGIEDKELRIDLMRQAIHFLPYLLALSTSSPFWRGYDTGIKSYRICAYNEWPRTGLPDAFHSWNDYEDHINVLVNAGVIEDGTKLWWDLRPSFNYPTLETRICDVCTCMDDAIAIAALNLCILRTLYRMKKDNKSWRVYSRMLLKENRWRAQRYGIDQGLLDIGRDKIVPFETLLDELLEMVMPEAEEHGCVEYIMHTKKILERGTSAHWQINKYREARDGGASREDALKEVIMMIADKTKEGVF